VPEGDGAADGIRSYPQMRSSTGLDQVRQAHRLRSLRIAAVVRVGVVAIMTGAMLMGTAEHEWPKQCVLLGLYGLAATVAVILAFSPAATPSMGTRTQFILAIIDVLMVFSFQLLSTGGYIPLLVMALLPIMVVLEVSWRRAAVVLAFSVVGFTISMLADPVMEPHLGWGETAFLVALYGLFCCTAWLVVYLQGQHVEEIAILNASREALLADTMSATEIQRREMSEAIDDGPLQDVLAARQEIAALAKASPYEQLSRAAATLQEASQQLREATFELHPAVLEQVGLGAAELSSNALSSTTLVGSPSRAMA
jgi:two-component system NarL family sensor kinase